jgi:hypothetical protein
MELTLGYGHPDMHHRGVGCHSAGHGYAAVRHAATAVLAEQEMPFSTAWTSPGIPAASSAALASDAAKAAPRVHRGQALYRPRAGAPPPIHSFL